MSPLVASCTPVLESAFLVLRVTDQSEASDLPSTTRRGKVSGGVSDVRMECWSLRGSHSGLGLWLLAAVRFLGNASSKYGDDGILKINEHD